MNEITTIQKCIQLRSGVEIWIDAKKADALMGIIQERERTGKRGTFQYEGRLINIADLVGIFKPEDMENSTRRKNGEWACQSGHWHSKGEKCDCLSKEEQSLIQRRVEAIKACGKCTNGFVMTETGAAVCQCQKPFQS